MAARFAESGARLERPALDWEANQLVFVVREPFVSKTSSAEMVCGKITPEWPLVVKSEMPENGVVFSDGVEADFLAFNAGAMATIGLAEKKTNWWWDDCPDFAEKFIAHRSPQCETERIISTAATAATSSTSGKIRRHSREASGAAGWLNTCTPGQRERFLRAQAVIFTAVAAGARISSCRWPQTNKPNNLRR